MARIRTIKPEFWLNEQLAACSEHARLLAIALLNIADDEGYFKANVKLIRAACFPFDDDSMTCHGSIQELSRIGYIEVRTMPCGREIGRVVTFLEHQRIEKKKPSTLSDDFDKSAIKETAIPGRVTDESRNNPGQVADESRLERKGMEGEMEGERNLSCTEPASGLPVPAIVPAECRFPVFPCSGGNSTWQATEIQLESWRSAYPGIDVDDHHRRAHSWVMANLTKRKTSSGMAKFLNAWFAKEQDHIPFSGRASPKTFAQQSLENSMNAIREFGNGRIG